MPRMKNVLLFLFLVAAAIAQTPPAPPTGASNPLLPPEPLVLWTNTVSLWTNVALKSATISFDSVSVYGGSNTIRGAVVISWVKSAGAAGYKLYYGPVTLAQTNLFLTRSNISTVLFFNVLSTNDTYWLYVTATNATVETAPSNVLVVRPP